MIHQELFARVDSIMFMLKSSMGNLEEATGNLDDNDIVSDAKSELIGDICRHTTELWSDTWKLLEEIQLDIRRSEVKYTIGPSQESGREEDG